MPRKALAEFLGTALLIVAVIGSGIAATRLSPGNVGLELLENAAATAGALVALILTFGPVSGAHFNPVVTLADRAFGHMTTGEVPVYVAAQVMGGAAGALIANAMFGLATFELSTKARATGPLWFAEAVATFGLLIVILGVARSPRPGMVALAVGGYIGGAYFFTSSTSFANPAVTIARMFSNSFAGIQPASAPAFIAAQLAGGSIAIAAAKILFE